MERKDENGEEGEQVTVIIVSGLEGSLGRKSLMSP
jgi:hypothetical protein